MKYISFNFLIIMVCGILQVSSVLAEDRISGKQVSTRIIEEAQAFGVRLEPKISHHKIFYPCNTPLDVKPRVDTWKTVEVRCTSPYEWKLNVRSEITLTKVKPKVNSQAPKRVLKQRNPFEHQYVILLEPLGKGTVLNKKTAFGKKRFKYEVHGAFTEIEHLIGRKLKSSISSGKPILSRNLLTHYNVEKDTILDLIYQKNGVTISTKAVAMSNAQVGEIIEVANTSSNVILKAKVRNSKEAEVLGLKFE